jgi:hypothetical protein
MEMMDEETINRIRRLQARVNAALQETPENRAVTDFSEYIPDHWPALTDRLNQAAMSNDLNGLEAALDEFDRLALREDRVRLQHALMVFLTEHPAAAGFGINIPSLEERSPWKVLPSRKSAGS